MYKKITYGLLRLHILHSAKNGQLFSEGAVNLLTGLYPESNENEIRSIIMDLNKKGYIKNNAKCSENSYLITKRGEEALKMALDAFQNSLGDLFSSPLIE